MHISSISGAQATGPVQNGAKPQPPAKPTSQPQDSVHLSATALAASGDADHDGDSH